MKVNLSLLKISYDTTLLLRHKNESLSQFWISLENEYSFLSLNAIKMLVIYFQELMQENSLSISSNPNTNHMLARVLRGVR